MKLFVALCLLGLSLAFTIERQNVINDESWHLWKGRHEKTYADIHEEKLRYTIWQDNLRKIIEHNSQTNDFKLRMNHFGDMTNYEFRRQMNGYIMKSGNRTGSTFLMSAHVTIPSSVDWRTKGYVTPVKDQKQCGSCWAFSTTGSLEGQHFKKSGELVSLSEQQLVDCDRKSGDMGCRGGLMDYAFGYIRDNGGIDTEESYPYKGVEGTCKFKESDIGAEVSGFTDIKSGDEEALKQASATVGPISVGIDASHSSFQFYSEGVYNEQRCSSTRLDHGVLVVGYGTEGGKDYWLVKNSWGERWGLQGYIKMTRNKNNQCGVATQASYPLV